LPSKLGALAAACAVLVFAPASAALANNTHHHHHHHKKPKVTYLLALGDSLARGAQPFGAVQSNGLDATIPTNQGYANDLYKTEKKKIKGLKLKQLGCLGETTTTMMNGGICSYGAGSQLAQAERFIKSHKIKLITIDIGANDVDGCVSGGTINLPCVQAGVASIQANVPKIAAALRQAAGSKVTIVGMTYYDPFLAEYLAGGSGEAEAFASVQLSQQINTDLSTAYAAQKIKVADVATAFDTYVPFSTTATLPGVGTVPEAVAQVCELTWMCQPAPKGPNIHANASGYKLIAKPFAAEL
jgi:lysophospholipase L1-like esterase